MSLWATQFAADTLSKAQISIASTTMSSQMDKIKDFAQDSVEPSKNGSLTTDYGVKQGTADEWLRVANDQQTGPMLLEDPFARERVSPPTHLS